MINKRDMTRQSMLFRNEKPLDDSNVFHAILTCKASFPTTDTRGDESPLNFRIIFYTTSVTEKI